jgi:hypothetical protein
LIAGVCDRQVPETCAIDHAGPLDDLPLKAGFRFQFAGVEEFGGELTDRRMQPLSGDTTN